MNAQRGTVIVIEALAYSLQNRVENSSGFCTAHAVIQTVPRDLHLCCVRSALVKKKRDHGARVQTLEVRIVKSSFVQLPRM